MQARKRVTLRYHKISSMRWSVLFIAHLLFLQDFYFESQWATGSKALNTSANCHRSLSVRWLISVRRFVCTERPIGATRNAASARCKLSHRQCYLLSWKYCGLDLTFVVHCMMCGMHKNVPHVYFVISCSQTLRNKQTNERTNEQKERKQTGEQHWNARLANAFGQHRKQTVLLCIYPAAPKHVV